MASSGEEDGIRSNPAHISASEAKSGGSPNRRAPAATRTAYVQFLMELMDDTPLDEAQKEIGDGWKRLDHAAKLAVVMKSKIDGSGKETGREILEVTRHSPPALFVKVFRNAARGAADIVEAILGPIQVESCQPLGSRAYAGGERIKPDVMVTTATKDNRQMPVLIIETIDFTPVPEEESTRKAFTQAILAGTDVAMVCSINHGIVYRFDFGSARMEDAKNGTIECRRLWVPKDQIRRVLTNMMYFQCQHHPHDNQELQENIRKAIKILWLGT